VGGVALRSVNTVGLDTKYSVYLQDTAQKRTIVRTSFFRNRWGRGGGVFARWWSP
jgi:hypothetical protein